MAAVTWPWGLLTIINSEKGPSPSDRGHRGLWYSLLKSIILVYRV